MNKIYNGLKFYYDKSNGYMFRLDKKKMFLHRYIWEIERGEIPKGFEIHHKDGNKLNNIIDNLECISRGEHISKRVSQKRLTSRELKIIRFLDKRNWDRFKIAELLKRPQTTIFDVVSGRRKYRS